MAKDKAHREHELYQDEEKLRPQGPPRRRKSSLSEMLPVRMTPKLLEALRRRARSEERSVSWVVRRAIESYLAPGERTARSAPDEIATSRATAELARMFSRWVEEISKEGTKR